MRGANECVFWLWSQIVVPLDAIVRADIVGDIDDHPAVWNTIAALARHVNAAREAHPISGVAFFFDPLMYSLYFRLFSTAEDPFAETEEHRLSPLHRGHYCALEVVVVCDIDIDSLHDHLIRLCEMFGLAEVENLTIGALGRCDGAERSVVHYGHWLSAFRDVHNLCLLYYPFPVTYDDLSSSQQRTEPDYSLLYPHLLSLVLVNLSRDEDELHDVVKMVERRASHGIPLAELKIALDDTETPAMSGNPAVREFRTTLCKLVASVEFELPDES